MYVDSDDEIISGDEDELPQRAFTCTGFARKRSPDVPFELIRSKRTCNTTISSDEPPRATTTAPHKTYSVRSNDEVKNTSRSDKSVSYADTLKRLQTASRRLKGNVSKKDLLGVLKHKGAYDDWGLKPVFVVDYDLTLVDVDSKPFPGAKEFIKALHDYNNGHSILILFSHGGAQYIDEGMSKYFGREKILFYQVLSDNNMRPNKPVSYVRRVLKTAHDMVGPYVIIDDQRSNLDDDQYDITIDVTRYTNYGGSTKYKAIGVDYEKILCLIDEQFADFITTKELLR